MCAANQLTHLKPEILRAERFDKIFFVGLPSFDERIQILKIYLPDQNLDFNSLARSTEFFTGAEIKSLVKEVKFNVVFSDKRSVTTNDLLIAAPKFRNILWNKERQMIKDLYAYALDNWDWASHAQYEESNAILGRKRASSVPSWDIKG